MADAITAIGAPIGRGSSDLGEDDPVRKRLRRAAALVEWAWVPPAIAGAVPIVLALSLGSPRLVALGGLLLWTVVRAEVAWMAPLRAWDERRVLARAIRGATRCARIADAVEGELVLVRGTVRVVEAVRDTRGVPCAAYQRREPSDFVHAACGRLALRDESGVALVARNHSRFVGSLGLGEGAHVFEGDVVGIVGRARWVRRAEGGAGYRAGSRVLVIDPAVAGSILIVDRP